MTKVTGLKTIEQVMSVLSCSRQSIYRLHEEGKLELVKLRYATRVTDRSLNALLDELADSGIESLPWQPHTHRKQRKDDGDRDGE